MDELPEEYRESYDRAASFADSPELYRAFTELKRDDDLWRRAVEGGADVLREYGVDVPEGLGVDFYEGKPNPLEWTPFVLVLTGCRTYKKLDRTKRPPAIVEATVCRTVRIVPNPVPGGPWG